MSVYLGDFNPGDTVRCPLNSNDGAGAMVTLAGSPAVRVYKNGGTAQHSTTYAPTVDFDSLTGLHAITIDTSADGTFYSAAADYWVVLQAGTVDGTPVAGTLVFIFSIGNRSTAAIKTDTAAIKAKTDLFATSDGTLASATGTTAVLDATAPTPANNSLVGWRITVRDTTGLLQSRVVTANTGKTLTVATWTTTPDNTYTYTLDPAESYNPLIDAAVSSRLAPTTPGRTLDVSAGGEAGLDWANVGSPTTTLNLSGTTVKTATDIATLIGSAGAGLTALATQASVNAVDDLVDTEVAAIKTVVDAIKAITDLLTLAAIVDAVWDEPTSGHATSGTFGANLGSAGTPVDTIGDELEARLTAALTTTTYAEPSSVPAATSSLKDKINWLFALARNKVTSSATTVALRNDADSGNIATAAQSDDGTTYTRNEFS